MLSLSSYLRLPILPPFPQGVYSDQGCALSGLPDHSVAVVGYSLASESVAGDTPHWIVRNSWGDAWGEHGHMRIAMAGGDGVCNMHATPASYPTIASELLLPSPP
ncbi:hypothetical protein CLOP_g13467 [Closterium sp. NIES-67]|nr:hypothetical protein CLOP_g13467 [Closterium sp. NIES-67]